MDKQALCSCLATHGVTEAGRRDRSMGPPDQQGFEQRPPRQPPELLEFRHLTSRTQRAATKRCTVGISALLDGLDGARVEGFLDAETSEPVNQQSVMNVNTRSE